MSFAGLKKGMPWHFWEKTFSGGAKKSLCQENTKIAATPLVSTPFVPFLGFRNGTLERRYSRMMLSPPQNMKPCLGHCGWGRFDQKSFLMRGVIVPPFKLIVTNTFPPKGGFLIGGVSYEGGRSFVGGVCRKFRRPRSSSRTG